MNRYNLREDGKYEIIVYGNPKYNGIILIDSEDLDLVSDYTWRIHKVNNLDHLFYAIAYEDLSTIRMHRILMGIENPEIHIDYFNGNGLHNFRSNLRIVTRSENALNSKINSNNTSGKNGVYFRKPGPHCPKGEWNAKITINRKKKYKIFSVKKYGYNKAKEKAFEAMDILEKEFNIIAEHR